MSVDCTGRPERQANLGWWRQKKICGHPYFCEKSSERIENKGLTLQRATKSPEVADNNGDTLRIAEISSFEEEDGMVFWQESDRMAGRVNCQVGTIR